MLQRAASGKGHRVSLADWPAEFTPPAINVSSETTPPMRGRFTVIDNPTDTRVLLARITHDGPVWTAWALHLLTGLPVQEIQTWMDTEGLGDGMPDSQWSRLPADWCRAGLRRGAEARAHTNTADGLTGLRYFAGEMYLAELDVEDLALVMCLPDCVEVVQ